MRLLLKHIVPWLKIIASQICAYFILYYSRRYLPNMGVLYYVMVIGIFASLIGCFLFRLKVIFLPIQIIIPFAVIYSPSIPEYIYPVAFLILLLVFWNSASEQVPLYFTNRKTWHTINDFVKNNKSKSFVDLGSGSGGLVKYLATENDIKCTGVENAPIVYLVSKIRILTSFQAKITIKYNSIWDEDLNNYDVVYCFLSPIPMKKIYNKALKEMKKGSYLISNSFKAPNIEASEVINIDDGRQTKLYIYKI